MGSALISPPPPVAKANATKVEVEEPIDGHLGFNESPKVENH